MSQQFWQIILEREGPDCLARLICRGPDFAALSEHQLSGFGLRRSGGGLGEFLWGVQGCWPGYGKPGGKHGQPQKNASWNSHLLWIYRWWQCFLASVQWAAGRRCSYSTWTFFLSPFCGKFLFDKAGLCFPNCLCILDPNIPEKAHIAGAIQC